MADKLRVVQTRAYTDAKYIKRIIADTDTDDVYVIVDEGPWKWTGYASREEIARYLFENWRKT